jgi:hypothetical protein
MFCFICGRPARIIIGQHGNDCGLPICDKHYYLMEKYRPQPCHICEQVAPVARIVLNRDGSEMAVCAKCCGQLDLDKHIVLKCQKCGRAAAYLKNFAILKWLEVAERTGGWSADYVGLALKGESILRDVAACPRCNLGLWLFPCLKNGGRPCRFFIWPEFDREELYALDPKGLKVRDLA